jgi:hypothetical protein
VTLIAWAPHRRSGALAIGWYWPSSMFVMDVRDGCSWWLMNVNGFNGYVSLGSYPVEPWTSLGYSHCMDLCWHCMTILHFKTTRQGAMAPSPQLSKRAPELLLDPLGTS